MAAKTAKTVLPPIPPILSPTLPSDWDAGAQEVEDMQLSDLPSEPLSPSLPPDFDIALADDAVETGSVSELSRKSSLGPEKIATEAPSRSKKIQLESQSQTTEISSNEPPSLLKRRLSSKEPLSSKPRQASKLQSDSKGSATAKEALAKGPQEKVEVSTIPESGPGKVIDLKDDIMVMDSKGANETNEVATKSSKDSVKKRASSTPLPSPKKSRAVIGDNKNEFNGAKARLQRWIQIAQEKKHESDAATRERKHRLAALLSVDAAVCFCVGFDCDDRAERLSGGSPRIRSWQSLIPYLSKAAAYLESVDADLAGVCCQLCAVVRIHISRGARRSDEAASTEAAAAAVQNFRRGLQLLPLHAAAERYSLKSWIATPATKLNPDRFDPAHDEAALPLHVTSAIQEAAAFAYRVGRGWASKENIEYQWACTE